MNVTEFAEQIVFGKTLEDKLIAPGKLTIDPNRRRGELATRVDSLVSPGRSIDLQMRHDKGGSLKPPSDDQLENEYSRGQLLHFLANHELLATELMALVLLKFPDAPHAFRQGVLVTLREEQEHTRMYMRRMKECGVEFGSFPLSGQFWRIVEPMKSPMDFVSRLSLTFEQANLDYSLHFANVFRQIGDLQTAEVLQKIYIDEIGHVQHGLEWFRQWKDPQHSDWEAYQESLEFPMSPQRGRGPRGAFNRDGRKQAGLTDEFINAIEVFRQSRGRSPTVRWFDPGAEAELAGELSENSTKNNSLMDRLAKDLELVMLAMSRQDDVLLVRRMPSREIRKRLIDAGLELPEFVLFDEREKLSQRQLHNFSPWAWTPNNHEVARPMIESAHHAPGPWRSKTTELFRKSWSSRQLRQWTVESKNRNELPNWFSTEDCTGIPINTKEEFSAALNEIADRGYSDTIFKRDLAASGRGQRKFSCREKLSDQDEAWIRSVFRDEVNQANSNGQPIAILEPQLDRLIDLSFLWRLPQGSSAADYLGWTRPLVTIGRRYSGTRLGNAFDDCDSTLKRFLLENRASRLQTIAEWLEPRISHELTTRQFVGHFGIDAFVYRGRDGDLKIKPLVELNPRMTMGHIALNLQKRLAPGAVAEFRLLTIDQWRSMQTPFDEIQFSVSRDGHWQSGVVRLSESDVDSKLIAVLLIGDQAMDMANSSK